MRSWTTSICVSYRNVGGWHVFVSDELPGLYVAHQSAEVAYNDISNAIEKLLKLNQGVEVRAEPEVSFAQFLEDIKGNYIDDSRAAISAV